MPDAWPADHLIPVVGVIVRDGDRVLLVQPHGESEHWLISGYLEAWESVEQAAVREAKEEVGLDIQVERIVGTYSCRPIGKSLVFVVCLARSVGGELHIGDELIDARWFAIDDLPAWPSDSPAAVAMRDLLAKEAQTPTFLLMKGPPGSGKSTLAKEIGRRLRWPVIDKDAVRDHLPDELGGLSYAAMLEVAARQLAIGLSVIADSPLGYGESYTKAVEIGRKAGARILVLECECSDQAEWRRRIEQRAGTGLAAHHATDWAKVEAFYERTAADQYSVDSPRLVVDTVAPLDQTLATTIGWLQRECSADGDTLGPSGLMP